VLLKVGVVIAKSNGKGLLLLSEFYVVMAPLICFGMSKMAME
jgi:hypothetical protein